MKKVLKVLSLALILPTATMPCSTKQLSRWTGLSCIGTSAVLAAASVVNLVRSLNDTTDPERMVKVYGWAAGIGSSIVLGISGVALLVSSKKTPTIEPLQHVKTEESFELAFVNPFLPPVSENTEMQAPTQTLYDTSNSNSSGYNSDSSQEVINLAELFEEPNMLEETKIS